ncbi:MAG: YceI family protein [Anaerolineae bacterium]|nr:YceI family protein [Anaerolineae bacterium]
MVCHPARAVLILLVVLAACGPSAAPATATPAPTVTAPLLLNVIPAETRIGFTSAALGGSVQVQGTYGALGGVVAISEEAGQRRIRAVLLIDMPTVTVGMGLIDEALRLGLEAAAYPVGRFDATSTELVPITEEPIAFMLAGTLDLHGQVQPVTMVVDAATLINEHLHAQTTMSIDLANFGISLLEAVVSSRIRLDVTLVADGDAPALPITPAAGDGLD